MAEPRAIQFEYERYQGKPPPGTLARPHQPKIIERGLSGEIMRPGWAVKFDYGDQKWYLPDDSEGALQSKADANAAPTSTTLGDYAVITAVDASILATTYYDTDGTTALTATKANDNFRYVQQAANTNRWVRVSDASTVGANGQKAVPRHSDRANIEGILFNDPNALPKTAAAIPAGSNFAEYAEYEADVRIQVVKLGAVYVLGGAVLKLKDRVEFDPGDNKNWVKSPSTPRSNLRTTLEVLETTTASGQISAVRAWGPRY